MSPNIMHHLGSFWMRLVFMYKTLTYISGLKENIGEVLNLYARTLFKNAYEISNGEYGDPKFIIRELILPLSVLPKLE